MPYQSIILAVFDLSAFGYNQRHRDASIQADLNKLYDTRPTSESFSDGFSQQQKIHQEAAVAAAAAMSTSADEAGGAGDPYFDLAYSGNVTAVLGKTALMNCRVKNIGNKTVSLKKLEVNGELKKWKYNGE